MKSIYWENLVKNSIILLLLIFSFYNIQTFIYSSTLSTDKSAVGSLLIVVSILAVTACFGNFAFTYEKVAHKDLFSRLLAHLTTGLFMFLIGLSLEMTSVLTSVLIGNFQIFNLSLIVLYVACMLYDFWDLKKAEVS